MSKKNTREEVQTRINALQEQKTIELLDLKAKIADARQQENEAAEEMRKATEVTDLDAYTLANEKKDKCAKAAEMYEARYTQLQSRRLVSEEESDSVIDSLKNYEDELSDEYEAKVNDILQNLLEVTTEYKTEIAATERTLHSWTGNIHPNYRSEFTTYRDGTHRSPVPVPVRNRLYLGSDLSERVYGFLKGEKLYPDTKTIGII